jgi:glycosyltransferase involved in cell wall biosynthesis
MKTTTILMIGNYLNPLKWNKNVWHFLAEGLKARGWNVITTSNKPNQIIRLLDMVWYIISKRQGYNLAQVDVFSGRAFFWSEVCTVLLKKLHKPIVLTLHGGKLPEFARKYPRRIKRVLQRADVVVSPSPFHKIALKEFRENIRYIPNPISLKESLYKQRLDPHPKLIWVRAFHEVYNPSLAVRIVGILVRSIPEIELIMIGPDKRDGSLQNMLDLADEIGVRSQIKIINGIPHTEVPSYLNRGDIFINTTNYDTAPRSVLEAMANGLCIVSTNVGGMPWLITHDLDGLLVPPNDPEAMAEAVLRVLREPGLAANLSSNARKKSEAYDWSGILPQWEDLFISLL